MGASSRGRGWVRLAVAGLMAAGIWTGAVSRAQESAARPLVVGAVDLSQRVTLRGSVSAVTKTGLDLGRVEDSFTADGLYLVLKRPPERETALRQFLIDAATPGSAEYRHWLTPEEFGRRFGPADSDMEALQAWLESEGLRVETVHPGRIGLRFSGTAGAVNEALHMEMHRYAIGRGELIANATEVEIPAVFHDLVAGISPMQAGRARPQIAMKGRTSYNAKTHIASPQSNDPAWNDPATAGTIYEMAPGDFAVQYGLKSVYAAGNTGGGQAIGVVSASNVDLSLVQAYRALFNLPATVPTVVVDGNDPGITEDAPESYLDLEEAGAVAPGASLVLYTSAGTVLGDPLLEAAMRAVADNQVNVLSVSYATCEAALGVGGNAAWASLWQEAAAQGISVFVAAGDAGSAGCDDPENESIAESGLGVNGLASTPYDTAVGGTDLYYSNYAAGGSTLAAQVASYWGSASTNAPAVSLQQPVPEQIWNDAFGFNTANAGVYSQAAATIFAGGGGSSSAAILSASGAPAGYPKPVWQSGAGVPADGVRDMPDVALFAGDGANGVYTPVCALPGDCVNTTTTGAVTVTSVGGTSVAAPAMAGIQALINASLASSSAPNPRSGLTAGIYYALSTKFAAATAKPLNDTKTGTNQVPCYAGTLNCALYSSGQAKGSYAQTGYLAGTSFDRASGLGSVNAATLITDWPAIARRATTSTLTVTPATLAHGTAATVQVSVVPSSGTGTPTGSVALISSSQQEYANGLAAVTLASAAGTKQVSNLPGGAYSLTVVYGGDLTFAQSTSAPVSVTVTQEADTLTTSGWVLNPLDGALYPMTAGMQIPYGSEIYLDAQPVGVNEASAAAMQNARATGVVVFTDHIGAAARVGTVALNAAGVAEWAPGTGVVGAHAVSASYAGDASYAASSASTAASYTVFKGTTTLYLAPEQKTVAAGGSVTVDLQLYSQYLPLLGSLPTGSVTVTLGGQSKTATWSSSGPAGSAVEEAVVTFTSVPAGILPLSASYVGDANWYGSSLVWGTIAARGTKALPTVTLTASAAALSPAQSVTLTGTVTGVGGSTAPSGSLMLTWNGGSTAYAGTLAATGAVTSAAAWNVPGYLFANGTNLLLASYAGDGSYAPASSAPLTLTVTASDFAVNTTTQEVAVMYGKPVAGSILLTPINGFNTPVTVSCVSPAGITCAPTYATVTMGGGLTDPINLSLGAGAAAGTWPVEIVVTGGEHTHSAQILVAATPAAAAPLFTPAAGAYSAAQSVTITDATPGAAIYYTTNGTTPTTASTKYTGPISVAAAETIKAIAAAPGYVTSAVSTATYTITPQTATPVFTPVGGTYTATQSVTITDATSGAAIYYTTDGTTPTASSTKYAGAISVASTETIKAVAIASGYTLSGVASATYTITAATAAAVPTFTPAAGTYTTAQSVTITDATTGAAIYYTTNGTTPTTASTKYSGPIPVSATMTIEAIAVANGLSASPVASAVYTIAQTVANPTFSPAPGTYTAAQSVTISDSTAGAAIFYTTNGTLPTTSSARYTGPITVSATQTIRAMAARTGYTSSAAVAAAYTINSASTVGPTGPHLPGPGSPLPKR